jgi:hypothetical protein
MSVLFTMFMSLNVFFVVFYRWNSKDLKKNEQTYCFSSFLFASAVALVPLVISNKKKGPIYGNADLWCWIRDEWGLLRIIMFYVPVVLIFMFNVVVYSLAGMRLWKRTRRLKRIDAEFETFSWDSWKDEPTKSPESCTTTFSDSANMYMRSFITAVSLYLLAFLLSWVFGIINRVNGLILDPSTIQLDPDKTEQSSEETKQTPKYVFYL